MWRGDGCTRIVVTVGASGHVLQQFGDDLPPPSSATLALHVFVHHL